MEKNNPTADPQTDTISMRNNITGDPQSDGVGNLKYEPRNELFLSEDEIDAGLGKGPFDRDTLADELRSEDPDHPQYRHTDISSRTDPF